MTWWQWLVFSIVLAISPIGVTIVLLIAALPEAWTDRRRRREIGRAAERLVRELDEQGPA